MNRFPQDGTLVTHDFSVRNEPLPPEGLHIVGSSVYSGRAPSFSTVDVLMEADVAVAPGEFLLTLHPGQPNSFTATVVQVGECIEVNPNETPELATARRRLELNREYAGEGQSVRIHRIAQCESVEEFTIERRVDGFCITGRSQVKVMPRSGYAVARLPAELEAAVVGGLPDPEEGIHLGHFVGGQHEAVLKPSVLQLGTLIVGNPGSGKSYLAGNVLEELHGWQVPAIILDVNGEFGDAVKALGGKVVRLPSRNEFGLKLQLLTPSELVSVTPNVDPNSQYGELIALAHERCRNETSRSSQELTFAQLLSAIESMGADQRVAPLSIRTAVARISALSRDELFGGEFDFIAEMKKHRLVSLDCRYISLRQTRLIAAAAARILQGHGRAMTRAANNGDQAAAAWFSVLVVDEAHMLAPAGEPTISTQVLYELARMGRHVRTGLLLSTQSPADLDRSILKRLQTRFIFNLERDQLSAIGGVSSDFGERMLSQVPKLPQGVCAVSGTSEAVRHGFFMKVRERLTPVGGGTPSVFELRTKQAAGS